MLLGQNSRRDFFKAITAFFGIGASDSRSSDDHAKSIQKLNTKAWGNGFASHELVAHTVQSVDDLRRINPDPKCIVLVKGYNRVNDGGGGLFWWDAGADAAIANGGTTIASTVSGYSDGDANEGRWQRVYNGGPVNVKWFGALGNGVNDDTTEIQAAINYGRNVFLPAGEYLISSQLDMETFGQTLRGTSGNRWPGAGNTMITWAGPSAPRSAMLRVGRMDVGVDPDSGLSASGFTVEDIAFDGKGNAGIGIYSTYATNDTLFQGLYITGTTQHAFFSAKSWYATFRNIIADVNDGCGISLGHPLVWSDGTQAFGEDTTLQMNNVAVENLRAHTCGQDQNFDLSKQPYWGYGIAIGTGNGFRARHLVTENNDGYGLLCRPKENPSHTVSDVYVEGNMADAQSQGRAPKRFQIFYAIESTNTRGLKLEDVYSSVGNPGYIGHKGVEPKQRITLSNIFFSYGLESVDINADDVFATSSLNDNTIEVVGGKDVKERVPLHYQATWDIQFSQELVVYGGGNQMDNCYVWLLSHSDYSVSSGAAIAFEDVNGTRLTSQKIDGNYTQGQPKRVKQVRRGTFKVTTGGTLPSSQTKFEIIVSNFIDIPH